MTIVQMTMLRMKSPIDKRCSVAFFILFSWSESRPQSQLNVDRQHGVFIVELCIRRTQPQGQVKTLSDGLPSLDPVVVMAPCRNIPAVFDCGEVRAHDFGILDLRCDRFVKAKLATDRPCRRAISGQNGEVRTETHNPHEFRLVSSEHRRDLYCSRKPMGRYDFNLPAEPDLEVIE